MDLTEIVAQELSTQRSHCDFVYIFVANFTLIDFLIIYPFLAPEMFAK